MGTSVTVVLIGTQTSTRQYVGYEIKLSHKRLNGMLGIYIHNIKDVNSRTDTKGANPFESWYVERDGKKTYFSELYPTYDWVSDDGYHKLGDWIEAAAKKAGKQSKWLCATAFTSLKHYVVTKGVGAFGLSQNFRGEGGWPGGALLRH